MNPLIRNTLLTAAALVLASAAALAHQSAEPHADTVATATPESAISDVTPAAPVTDAAAEEARARAYFTDLPVQDQDGRSLRFYSDVLKGRLVLINFVFTNCDSACPLATQKMKSVAEQLGGRLGESLFFISISVDPTRDTPAAMHQFAKAQGALLPGWLWLTGREENVLAIVKRLGQYSDDVSGHSTLMLAGNVPRAHWSKVAPMATVPQIATKLQSMAGEL